MEDETMSSRAADGSTGGSTGDLRGPAWVGARVESGDPIPAAGTWEVVDHPDRPGCPGAGKLRALGKGEPAPRCPQCDSDVAWQLGHLAVTVSADHPDPDASS
jgi:hypothetical protein